MKNEGKKFEEDFKKSVPETVYFYRLRDGTASWDGGENTRFQASNICDCLLYDGNFYMFELKSHKGKSIPFSAFRDVQVTELATACEYGVKAGFVINMRDAEQTYYLTAMAVKEYTLTADRASIPLDYMKENGILLKAEKKRVRWRYDVSELLKSMEAGQ